MRSKLIFLSLLLPLLFTGTAFAQNKTALLIANGDYKNFSSLANPVPEARHLRDALQKLGFQVTLITDASREEMLDGLMDFERVVRQRGGIAFFHYGGHAVQVAGSNYLIPASADIPDERRVSTRAVDAEEVMATLEASGSDTNIVVLDSCRNNPLPAGSGRSVSRGLAVAGRKPPNSIIVYAAESGTTARDGVFTPALIQALSTEGKSFQEILMQTRQRVYEMTKGAQIPGAYDQLFKPVYLEGIPAGMTSGPASSPGKSIPAAVVSTDTVPEGFVLVKAGSFTMGSPSSETGRIDNNETQHRVTLIRDFFMGKYEVTQAEYREVMGSNPSNSKGDDLPVETVSWYDAVEYCNKLSQREGLLSCYSGSGDTIQCDFNANGYRLPTQAEWEYAARGGQFMGGYQTYAGSNDINAVGWYMNNSSAKKHPVGQKSPNSLDLYDMSGNVSEWCWDRYSFTVGTETDPRGGTSGSYRVSCGGNACSFAIYCRSAHRNGSPCDPSHLCGFRIVRTVE